MAIPVAVKAVASATQLLLKKDNEGKPIVLTLVAGVGATVAMVLLIPFMTVTMFFGLFFSAGSREPPASGLGMLVNPCPGYTRVTSEFEERINPITGKLEIHGGLDLAAPEGTPIYAAGAGTVITSGWHNSYGNYVMIDHGAGMVTLYGHMRNRAVIQGQTVIQMQCIGYVGSTGDSTGNHVHFEVQVNGKRENPRTYM